MFDKLVRITSRWRLSWLIMLGPVIFDAHHTPFISTAAATELDTSQITVYCRDSFADTWGQHLTQQFAPHVKIVKLSGHSLLTRVRLEQQRSAAHILLGIDITQVAEIQDLGLTTQHNQNLKITRNIIPTVWPDTPLIPLAFDYLTILTHDRDTNLHSLSDLCKNPRTLIIPDPRTSTTGLEFLYWVSNNHPDGTMEFWQTLQPAIISYPKGLSSSFALFMSSPRFVTIGYSKSVDRAARINNIKIKAYPMAGTPIQVYGAIVTPRGQQHHLTADIINYLQSESFQQTILAKDDLYPAVGHAITRDQLALANLPTYLSPPPLLTSQQKDDLISVWLRTYH